MDQITKTLAAELGQKESYIENVVTLLDEGNTIPFIARYRKEMHGSMDDTTLRNLETRLNYLRNLQERKGEVIKSIENQGKLTDELIAFFAQNHFTSGFRCCPHKRIRAPFCGRPAYADQL